MKLSIFSTATNPIERGDPFNQAMQCYEGLADEVVLNSEAWAEEFDWSFIGEQFQKGYEACTGDWVIHADLDFIFHEQDYERIRKVLARYHKSPAVTFWKWQFFTPYRYNLKSRLVIAVNKSRFGNQIKFNGGGDLCQPTIDGYYINPLSVPEARIPIYNYDEILKTKQQLLSDKGRFARAWFRTFGEYTLGGPDDESAYDKWYEMVKGRFTKHTKTLRLEDHPKVMQETIKNLTPENFGYSGFGLC